MENKNKLVCMLLAIAMLFTLMSGCGGSEEASTDEGSEAASATETADAGTTEEEQETEEAETEEETEAEPVAAYFPVEETVKYDMVTMTPTGISDYNDLWWWQELETRTNVHIDFIFYPSREMQASLMILLGGGDYPDMIANFGSTYNGGLEQAINEDICLDIAPYLDEYMPNYKAVIESEDIYYKGAYCDIDNTMIGQACTFYTTDRSGVMGFVTRGDYLDELGIDYHDITTYDEWHDLLLAYKTNFGVTSPLTIKSYGNSNYGALSGGYGVTTVVFMAMDTPFTVIDGEVHFSPFDEEGFLDYLNMMQTWYDEGLILMDYMSNRDGYDVLMLNYGVSVFDDYVYNMQAYDGIIDDPDYYLVPLTNPVVEEGGESYLGANNEIVSGEGISVTTQCEDIETILHWLDYTYSEDGHIFANYGVEGVSYEIVDDEYVLTDLVINDPENLGYSKYTMPSKFNFVEIYARRFSAYTDYQKETLSVWNVTNAYRISDLVTMTPDESEAFSVAWNDIGTLTEEFVNLYITGASGESDYAEYCETVNSMAIDDCISYKQAAYDRYAAKYLGG